MEYMGWGKEYLQQADRLQKRIGQLREKARTVSSREEADELARRAALLYDMYLDCLHAGRLLQKRGRRNAA